MNAPTAALAASAAAVGAITGRTAWLRRRARGRLVGRTSREWMVAPNRWTGLLAAALATAAAALLAGPAAAVVTAVVAIGIPRLHRAHRHAELRSRRRDQFPEALERLAVALRSGLSLPVALSEAGRISPAPVGGELVGIAREAVRGRPVAEVLDDWTRAHDDPATRLAATALLLATVVGAAPARAIDGVAATLRERAELARERKALASQARASSIVLSTAPLVFAVLLAFSEPAAGRFLFGTSTGWVCLVAGLALDGLGMAWMARMIGPAER